MRRSRAVLFAVALGACQGECPLAHCYDVLVVTWPGASRADRGTVLLDGTREAFDCAAEPRASQGSSVCTPEGLWIQGRWRTVSVEVSTTAGVRRLEASPTYAPNVNEETGCATSCVIARLQMP